jgi:hypothetical protein
MTDLAAMERAAIDLTAIRRVDAAAAKNSKTAIAALDRRHRWNAMANAICRHPLIQAHARARLLPEQIIHERAKARRSAALDAEIQRKVALKSDD